MKAPGQVKVHHIIHLDWERVRDLPRRRLNDPDVAEYIDRLVGFFKYNLSDKALSYVADLDAPEGPRGLSEAYTLSNSVEAPWVESAGVRVHPWVLSSRSTSVGDLILVDDQAHLVDSFGFVSLPGVGELLQREMVGPVQERLKNMATRERNFEFDSPSGFRMRANLVLKGDQLRKDYADVHPVEEPLIRFYDLRYQSESGGQLMSSYYLATFLDVKDGLQLDGGVPGWALDRQQVAKVSAWARDVLGVTPERVLEAQMAVAQLGSALGGRLEPDMFGGQWVTSSQDRLICGLQLRAGDGPARMVKAEAVFAGGSDELVSVSIVHPSSGEVLAVFESEEAPVHLPDESSFKM